MSDWDADYIIEDRVADNFYLGDVSSCCSILDVAFSGEGLEPEWVEEFTKATKKALNEDFDNRQTAIFYEVKNLKELIPEMEKHGWIATKPQLRSRHGPYPVQQFVYMTKKPKEMK